MDRRKFIKDSTISAVAISASGFIRFCDGKWIGDCETTSDILGPFYRPGAPTRNNLLIGNDSGQITNLSGIVRHKDCRTPVRNAVIELWHCNSNGQYDNDSERFNYRGKTVTGEDGEYSFRTILPVPYSGSEGGMRPAHYHFLISAEGYPSLITQIYFSGDKYIPEDKMAASPAAESRILKVVDESSGEKIVSFDIVMKEKIVADPVAIDKLAGTYTNVDDRGKQLEIFRYNTFLWLKNEVYGFAFDYAGENVFRYPGINDITLKFKLLEDGTVMLTKMASRKGSKEQVSKWKKNK